MKGIFLDLYLAGKWEARARLREVRAELVKRGHTVVGTWLDEEGTATPTLQEAVQYAIRDLAELRRANAMFLDTLDENSRGGREAEWGYSLGRMQHQPRIIVGPVRNVFHSLASARFDTWEACFAWLDT
jgi:hypothetical protein